MEPSPEQLAVMRQDFDKIDADHSGYIQGAELSQLLASQLGRAPTEKEITMALQQHDCDLDGRISFEEYVAWVYNRPAAPTSQPASTQDDQLLSLAEEVRAADDACAQLGPPAYAELKALHKPPEAVALTCTAAKLLVERPDVQAGTDCDGISFGSSATIVLVFWLTQSRKLIRERVIDGRIRQETLEQLNRMIAENPTWTASKAAMAHPAAGAVCRYIFAVLGFCNRATELGLELGKDGQVQVPAAW